MRQAFAHDAVVVLDAGGDDRAPGGAITVELCGHWDHEPPCPLAAHHTGVRRTRANGVTGAAAAAAAGPASAGGWLSR